MSQVPETERDPVTDDRHGETITDPYRWLEGDSEAVREWERRQNEFTDGTVDTDTRDALAPAFESLGWRENYFLPTVRGGRYFQRVEAADAEQPALTVRSEPDGESRTLVDPGQFDDTTALQWFVPDWDGQRLVYGLVDGGTEQYDLRVLDVDDGTVLDRLDDVGRCNPGTVAWDGEGFYYGTTGSADEGGQLDKELRYHEIAGEDRLVTADFEPERWPAIQVGPDSDLVLVTVGELGADSAVFVLENGELDPVISGVDASFSPAVANGRVYLLTNHEAPRGRVLGLDAGAVPDADGPEDFETVVDESDDVLTGLSPAGDGLTLQRIREARSVVTLHDADGSQRRELSLPAFAGIPREGIHGSHDSPEVFLTLSGFDRPESVVHVDAGPDAGPNDWRVVQSPTLPESLDPRGGLALTVQRHWAESADGTELTVYTVHRSDLDPDDDTPAVLYGYGGFRIPLLPGLDPYRLPFLADGGVFALANLRGGLEFGETWHEDGARENKEHTFEDFEAAAALLAEEGYTSPERLAAWGGSNGGLLVGAALTRSPEQFGAVVCSVPLLDMLRYHRFLLGRAWTGEYGSPENPEAFEWLRSYSPYHNVEEREYPATLFATAAGDTRVHPAHARKMTARVQHATTGEAPICYRSVAETGHGIGTPTSLEIEQALDKWTFVYEMLDVDPDASADPRQE